MLLLRFGTPIFGQNVIQCKNDNESFQGKYVVVMVMVLSKETLSKHKEGSLWVVV